jgi:hypothetical protein
MVTGSASGMRSCGTASRMRSPTMPAPAAVAPGSTTSTSSTPVPTTTSLARTWAGAQSGGPRAPGRLRRAPSWRALHRRPPGVAAHRPRRPDHPSEVLAVAFDQAFTSIVITDAGGDGGLAPDRALQSRALRVDRVRRCRACRLLAPHPPGRRHRPGGHRRRRARTGSRRSSARTRSVMSGCIETSWGGQAARLAMGAGHVCTGEPSRWWLM